MASIQRNVVISVGRINDRISELERQLRGNIENIPERRRELSKRQIIGRILELKRLRAFLTGGKKSW